MPLNSSPEEAEALRSFQGMTVSREGDIITMELEPVMNFEARLQQHA